MEVERPLMRKRKSKLNPFFNQGLCQKRSVAETSYLNSAVARTLRLRGRERVEARTRYVIENTF